VPDQLYILDPGSLTTVLVGSTAPYTGLQGLAFDAAGALYSWDVGMGNGIGDGLVLIDPGTGTTTDVNPAIGNPSDIQALATSPNGTMYGARSSLFVIDTASGNSILVAVGGGTCTVRNGTGINPLVCNCATPPTLGTNFTVSVGVGASTAATFVFVSDIALPVPFPLFTGEALIGPPVGDIPGAGLGTHVLPLPANPAFSGIPLFLQGLRVNVPATGLELELTNGQDAVTG